MAQLVSAQPSVREVPSSIPGVNTPLFQLLSFLCSFDYGLEARKSGLEEAVNRPKLAFAVPPKYLSNETKIYIFITRIPRVVYMIFWGFFKNFIFPISGRYLQTPALKTTWCYAAL